MANLTEVINYDAGVLQLEINDPVQGGPSGVSNAQAKALANRTAWLKKHVEDIEQGNTVPVGLAKVNSQAFTGTPTVPTPPIGDSSLMIANTEFVQKTHSGLIVKGVGGNTNVTLTDVEAGYGVLQFTGALTGNIAVIVPSESGSWIVVNRTSGAFSLTLKTAAGTGIAVAQNKQQELFCDGTNVSQSTNDFTDTALTGAPTAPAPASGSNDTRLATASFVWNAVDGMSTVNVAGGANVTLTAAQAGTGIINLTGALTANINVILPTQSGQWVIINNTSGGFTVTAKMATGLGPALPPARAVGIYSDGTNVSFIEGSQVAWGSIIGTLANQTDLQAALNAKASGAHTHAAADVTSGVFAVARLGTGTANATTYLRGDGTWAVIAAQAAPAWGGIGGTLANQTDLQTALNAKAASSHSHAAADITSGVLAAARMGAGTANASTFLRGDGNWAVVPVPAAPAWGGIGGTLANQTDLQNALNAKTDSGHTHADKANLSGAAFTGAISAPTFNSTSSRRYKENIELLDADDALTLLEQIGFFGYNLMADGSFQYGVIGEDLADGPLDFVVNRNEHGEPESVNYQPLFVIAARAVQSLSARLARLESAMFPVQ